MITGDNAATGAAIATSCGILPPQLAQQVEEARTQMAAAAAAANSSSNHSQQQQQIAQLRQAVASLVAERKATAGSSSSNSSSESGSSSSSSSWLDGVLHGLGGTISGKADPDAGAALMSSVVSGVAAREWQGSSAGPVCTSRS
jgi:magnesium-transporting ATPase (P-type)